MRFRREQCILPINQPYYKKKQIRYRITFLGRERYLSFNPRKGICDWCGASDKRTNLHHPFLYLPIMPWACTIEICVSCHTLETRKLKPNWAKKKIVEPRSCFACDKEKPNLDKDGYQVWFANPPIGWLCRRCYDQIFRKDR